MAKWRYCKECNIPLSLEEALEGNVCVNCKGKERTMLRKNWLLLFVSFIVVMIMPACTAQGVVTHIPSASAPAMTMENKLYLATIKDTPNKVRVFIPTQPEVVIETTE
jgi:hypothetical protein